jgi:hypothetical protein
MMRKYKTAPHPFVIIPPDERKHQYNPGDTLGFGLTLVGRIADYLPYFIYAFEELGRIGIGRGRGKYSLLEVTSPWGDSGGESCLVYSGAEKVLINSFKLHTFEEAMTVAESFSGQDSLDIRFLTPTRIIYKGQLAAKPEFHVIFRNLIRRLSLLAYFYCDGAPEETDFKGLISRAETVKTEWTEHEWRDWERYSSRQDIRMKLGGFIGNAAFTGDLEPFLPYLIIGQHTHVGKGTSFGLGNYEITMP